MDNNRIYWGTGIAVLIVALAASIVIAISFATLEYYEIGFLRVRSTGEVDTTKVFHGGRYFKGPNVEFKAFRSDAHFVTLSEIDIFTHDKLEVELTAHFQYFLRPDELHLLHAQFDIFYEDVMRSSAIDALKGAVVVFTTRELTENRTTVEQVLYNAVRERLGGVCCRPNCDDFQFACPDGCVRRDQCTDHQKGLNVDVKYFQMTNTDIPEEVQGRRMHALVLKEEAERETLYQDAQVVRKQTSALVAQIKNEALEIKQAAEAQSETIDLLAQANYTNTIEKARTQGLQELFSTLNVTEQEHKNSFDYLRTLRGFSKAHLTVDFQQRIAGSL